MNVCTCGCGKSTRTEWALGHNPRSKPPTKPFDDRYLVSADGCWVWTGSLNSGGYGRHSLPGRRVVPAHRFAYERAHGPIPDGLHIDHLCRNRACVNPAHMEVVTNTENTRRGLSAKLTKEQAAEIKALAGTGVSTYKVARRYGVSATLISLIWNGERWADIKAAA